MVVGYPLWGAGAAWVISGGARLVGWFAAFHPPPNLPPKSRPSHNPLIRRCRPIGPIWSGCPPYSEIRGCAKVC